MSTLFGSLRRLVLAPSLSEVTFGERGFPAPATPRTEALEAIPQAVVCGFEWGIDSGDLWDVERRLNMVEPELRGFAYEGVTMAYTIRDAIHGHRTRDLLLGPGKQHLFLAYIGIGFAMARLPRRLWRRMLPDLTGLPYHPTMSWLAVDGYGFDLAYFHAGRWVDRQDVPAPYPWQGSPEYFPRAVDQGIGRALWFIHGAQPEAVAAAIARFARNRQADLWSGVGLAATFAGGTTAAGFATLREVADAYRPELALGTVFAVKGRTYAGFAPPHTETACGVLAEMSLDDAVALSDRTESSSRGADDLRSAPPYELWRQRIRNHFTAAARQVVE